ncbi:hypothetical protein Slin14017_G101810 [Septoria linicola]|nr:hypothetical protein Slin14017_G101810 [Septoria linicola]
MTSLSFYSACCAFLAASASARHLHRAQMHHHEHQRRQAVTTTSALTSEEVSPTTVNVPVASITAGNDAIADIQQIQEGLTDLPANLLSFVQAVEARLEDMERMLIELMGSSATIPVPTVLETQSATEAGAVPPTQAPTLLSLSASSSIPLPTITQSLASATAAIVYQTTFQTSRFTSTRIRTTTVPYASPTVIAADASQGLASVIPLASE